MKSIQKNRLFATLVLQFILANDILFLDSFESIDHLGIIKLAINFDELYRILLEI